MLHDLQILDGGGTAHVIGVLPGAVVTRTAALPVADAREAVFDGYALTKSLPTGLRARHVAESLLKSFIFEDAHTATVASSRSCTLRAHRAGIAGGSIERYRSPELDGF